MEIQIPMMATDQARGWTRKFLSKNQIKGGDHITISSFAVKL